MRICVLSDSHYQPGDPEFVFDFLEKERFDAILHAGDIGDISFYNRVMNYASTYCVAGNCDNEYNHQYFGTRQTLTLGGVKIGLIHGNQGDKSIDIIQRLYNNFRYDKPEVIVFGHTHKPKNEVIDGVLYFNPGSCAAKQETPTAGILTIVGDTIQGQIVDLRK